MMKKRSLEMKLEKLAMPNNPRPELEQYSTPAYIAADVIWTAMTLGDIQGKRVADLGSGGGVLGIGAALIGASSVTCYDLDEKMVALSAENARTANVTIEAICSDVAEIDTHFDTVLQNPPFGAQRKGADRPFLVAATRVSDVAYSLHMAETVDFVSRFCRCRAAEVQHIKNYKFKIPLMFDFHKKPVEFIDVALLRILSER